MIAGGAVVAPVALAAMGATAAYEALTKEGEAKPVSLGEPHEEFPTTVTTTYEEKPRTPEEFEKYLAKESPEEIDRHVERESPKAAESPISAISHEEITHEEFPAVTETVTTVTTTHEEKPHTPEEFEKYVEKESPEEVERHVERESPKAAESPISAISHEEITHEEFPTVTETVTTVTTTYEEKPHTPEEFEKYVEKESPGEVERHVEHESPKAAESPVSAISREEITHEEFPAVTETVTTVTTTYEEKPHTPEEFEKYVEKESPEEVERHVERESPKAAESPISAISHEEITHEEFPTVTETVTTVTTTYEEKPHTPEEFEKY
ncbi:hypothetical protein ANCCEY_05087, partial [Ancylostoma ceylanicum]